MISKSTFIAALALILVEHQSLAIKVVINSDSDQTNWGSFSFSKPITFTRAPTVYKAPVPEPEPVVVEPEVVPEPEVIPTPEPTPTPQPTPFIIPEPLPDYTSPGMLGDRFDHVANTSAF